MFIPFNEDIHKTLELVEQARREFILIRAFTSVFPDRLSRACSTIFKGQLFIPFDLLSPNSDDEHKKALWDKVEASKNVIRDAGLETALEASHLSMHSCVCRIIELRPPENISLEDLYGRVIAVEIEPSDFKSTMTPKAIRQFSIAMNLKAMHLLLLGQIIEGDVHVLSSGVW